MPSDLARAAAAGAEAGGRILLRHFGKIKPSDVTAKRRNDFVSFVDRASERAIAAVLRRNFPESAIVGEEGTREPGRGDLRWIVDPLDGTTNYVRGIPHFNISIAAERSGRLEYGLVADVLKGETFTSERGRGAFLNGRRIRVSRVKRAADALVLFGTPYRSPGELRRFLSLVARIQTRVSDHRRPGSAALDLCYVACGRADAFYELGLKPWDVAAGSLIVREAGGFVGDFKGPNDRLDRASFLATNGRLTGAFLRLLKKF